jgi:hypothetical protein
MAEKRAVNSVNKEMRDKEVGGLELDEKTLMGEGTSFQAAYVYSTLSISRDSPFLFFYDIGADE